MDRVFVYGTLKRGQGNHHWLRGAPFLGRGRLIGARLHDLGPYPMAVAGDGLIHGELFAVDEWGLRHLDVLEDAPVLYQRQRLRLVDGSLAWTYLGDGSQVEGQPLVPFADWGSTPVFLPQPIEHPDPPLVVAAADGRRGVVLHLAPQVLLRWNHQPLPSVSVSVPGGETFLTLCPTAP
ncbi:gamma-glutamylcyclotransferase [Cyanobium sp. Morenito 9A2]|uniref:gamma-glutamylcyclotransferase family protein n=1 Tax=Cyanobium sp. Morenito 9A2 TaxID=2823718 RepID=UPI0020CE3605|nr:gamma-glutamylcyclotransferase family protein [Cyanobium sp. Morenito 9A2]MCP9850793.1 gamma-glutamylcyclotransferase [Cyanobium sp. Morenito 9A2]